MSNCKLFIDRDSRPLPEKYRPTKWGAVAGQDRIVKQLREWRSRGGLGGKAYWLSGKKGTGKTTIARLIASTGCEPWNTEEMDAAELTAEKFRDIEALMRYRGICSDGRDGRAWIINEAHGLNVSQVRKLLTLLEPTGGLPAHVVFVFTTSVAGQRGLFLKCPDAPPLFERCVDLTLETNGLAVAGGAIRLKWIARKEGLDGQPLEKYEELLSASDGSMRLALQKIQAGAMCAAT